MPTIKLDPFTIAYLECALWSSMDESDEQGGEPLDKNYTIDDIAPDTLAKMIQDCAEFQHSAGGLISEKNLTKESRYSADELAGHDFWLTRNGHGAGFWDGDWLAPAGIWLTRRAKAFGECVLIVGDDGLIYC